jgi:4'-phosphopantetheinyl transferase
MRDWTTASVTAGTACREIGIDLELIREDLPCEQLAERFFSPREIAVLRAVPAHTRHEAFFTCWSCKEAYTKAVGAGLSLSLDRFDVMPAPEGPAVLLTIKEDLEEASRWSLRKLSADSGYVAALAVEGHCGRLKCWQVY